MVHNHKPKRSVNEMSDLQGHLVSSEEDGMARVASLRVQNRLLDAIAQLAQMLIHNA
jgi:hypothetical protein